MEAIVPGKSKIEIANHPFKTQKTVKQSPFNFLGKHSVEGVEGPNIDEILNTISPYDRGPGIIEEGSFESDDDLENE